MPRYYQTKRGYCFKKNADGKCCRISKNEYSKQTQLGAGRKKRFTGAGVIFLEKYRGRWAIPLIQNKWTRNYEDMGGTLEKKHIRKYPIDPPAQTAKEEVNEESRNLLDFDSVQTIEVLPYINRDYLNKKGEKVYYRCYFARIPSRVINPSDFVHNRKILDRLNKKQYGSYQETINLTRVYLSDLLPLLNRRGDILVHDVDGNQIKVANRTKACLRISKINRIKTNSSLRVKKITVHRSGFARGTKTIIFY